MDVALSERGALTAGVCLYILRLIKLYSEAILDFIEPNLVQYRRLRCV